MAPRRIPPARVAAALLLLGLASIAGVGGLVVANQIVPFGLHENPWTETTVATTKSTAGSIIDALERFRTARGRYPQALESLVPDYMAVIEPPSAGIKSWDYDQDEHGSQFVLRFGTQVQGRGPLNACMWYDSAAPGQWHVGEWPMDDYLD